MLLCVYQDNTNRIMDMKLAAKTLTSQIAKQEIIKTLPSAVRFIKKYVPAIGYVLYVKDTANNTIANVIKENGKLVLVVK